jgi:hypothetical protein
MIARLNDLTINDPSADNGFYLEGDILGLALPDIRTSAGVFSGRDGGFVGAQFFGSRYITLTGRAFSSDIATLEDKRLELQQVLSNRQITLRLVTYAGNSYIIECHVTRMDMPIDRSLHFARFKIELLAPDPVIYDDSGGVELSVEFSRVFGDGFAWPIEWPLEWPESNGATTVNNGGSVTILPRIELNGSMTNPVLTNITTGRLFALTGLATSPDATVVIDMRARTVTLNGGNITHLVSSNSTWWGLQPGGNDITLETGDTGDTVMATLSWRAGFMGI